MKYKHIELSEKSIVTFWSKVDKRGPDECWPWTGNHRKWGMGYGTFGPRLGRGNYVTSRVAWFLANGRQPELHVCHRCDNPPCCNPAHLFLGTAKDNTQDMLRKGRHWKSRQTHCKRGHAFDEANTYWFRTSRRCRACMNAFQKRKYWAVKQAIKGTDQ